MNNPYLARSLALTPSALRRIIHAVPREHWDIVTEDGRFTLREAVAHMADWEPILRGRMESAMHSPGTQIEAYDESQRAIEQNYAASDPLEQVDRFTEQREITVRVIELSRDMNATCEHPDLGILTVSDIAHMILGHDLYHVEHLTHYLGLGSR